MPLSTHSSMPFKLSRLTCCLTLTLGLTLSGCADKNADEYIQQAKQFVSQGDNRSAILELKSAVQVDPRSATARFELGQIYIEEKDFESAEKELTRALDLGYDAAKVIPLLSMAHQRTGAQNALADLDIEDVQLTGVEQLEVGYRKVQSFIELGKIKEANRLLAKLEKIDSASVYKGLTQALVSALDDDLETALEQAKALRKQAPRNPDVLEFTARTYMSNGLRKEAAEVYEAYVDVAPENLVVKFTLANMLVNLGNLAKAEIYIDELLEVNGQNGLLNELKSATRIAVNDFENALLASETAIRNGQNNAPVRYIAGVSAFKLGDYQKAVGHLSNIAEQMPDDHPGLKLLAASQLKAGMGGDTADVLSRIDSLDEQDVSLFSNTGIELIKSGDTKQAKALIKRSESLFVTPENLTKLGIIKLSLNDVDGLVDLEEAVAQAPESETALSTLASAYVVTNQLDKAMELAKKWQTLSPESIDGLLLQAEVEQLQNNFSAAAASLKKAEDMAPRNTALLVAKLQFFTRQNLTAEAQKANEVLLDAEPHNTVGLASLYAISAGDGSTSKAYQRIQAQLKKHPDDTGLQLLAARTSLVSEQPQTALDILSNIKPDENAPVLFWRMKAKAHLSLNQVDQAEAHFDQWTALYPNDESAFIGALYVLNTKRAFSKALDTANAYLKRKSSIQINIIRTHLLAMTNQFGKAKSALANIDAKYRDMPFLKSVSATIALSENRLNDALSDAKIAYEAIPSLDNVLLQARVLEAQGQPQPIHDLFVRHYERDPSDVRSMLYLADRKMTIDPQGAVVLYKQVLDVLPDNFMALNNLAYLLTEQGELSQAETLAKRAFELTSNNVAVGDTYAQVLIKLNKSDEAVAVYERLIDGEVQNEQVILNYVEALLVNGNKNLAQRWLDRSEFISPESELRIRNLTQTYSL